MGALFLSFVQRLVDHLLELLVHCGRETRNDRMWGKVEIEMAAVSHEEDDVDVHKSNHVCVSIMMVKTQIGF